MHDFTVGTASNHSPEGERLRVRVVHYKGDRVEFSEEQIVRLFWVKIDETPEGCWNWTGAKLPIGYGRITVAHRHLYSHRVSYEIHKGLIPDGLHIDHLCRNRACCNPEHLEAVTCRENIMRSPIAPAAVNARKTHCDHGHEFNEENTGHRDGGRYCRTCAQLRTTGSAEPLTIEPGDVPLPQTGFQRWMPARPGAAFTTGNGWTHLITSGDMRRFWMKVDAARADGCWQWIAGVESDGYGTFHLTSRPVKRQASAYRFAYLALVGEVPRDRILEHLCLNRRCVNPAHIVPVTRRTNEALRLARLAKPEVQA